MNNIPTYREFPLLTTYGSQASPLIYLDNGATTQKPQSVIQAISDFYTSKNANPHRGIYPLSDLATRHYQEARIAVQRFLKARSLQEIIFTKGTTESINLVAERLPSLISSQRQEIVITQLEHHANLVVWQQLCQRQGYTLRYLPISSDYQIDLEAAANIITPKTAIVAFAHISNVLGTQLQVNDIVKLAKEQGAYVLVDGAQAVSHQDIDVESLGCDFYAFSGHKMYGPMGIGVLWGKEEVLQNLIPYQFGGDMISEVSWQQARWNTLPYRFEAGTPNAAGAIGLKAAIDFLAKWDIEALKKHEKELLIYGVKKIGSIDKVTVLKPPLDSHVGLFSFTVEGIHPHDIASLLGDKGICVRAGHHCAMPLIKSLGLQATVRVSLALYNTKSDLDSLASSLEYIIQLFSK